MQSPPTSSASRYAEDQLMKIISERDALLRENEELKSTAVALQTRVSVLEEENEVQAKEHGIALARIHSFSRLRLPWDVLRLIFESVDVPTLATLGRVSTDVLAASSPLLYGTISLKSLKQLSLLFCLRNDLVNSNIPSLASSLLSILPLLLLPQPHADHNSFHSQIPPSTATSIYSYLSLSQIKNLSLNLTSINLPGMESERLISEAISISLSRMTGSYRPQLLLNSFQLVILCKHSTLASRVLSRLLPLLDPVRVSYDFQARTTSVSPVWINHPPTFFYSSWSRLKIVEMKGNIMLFRTKDGQDAVPHLDVSPRLILHLDASTLLYSRRPGLSSSARWIEKSRSAWGFDALQDGHLVLVVRSQRQKTELESGVRKLDHATRALITIYLKP